MRDITAARARSLSGSDGEPGREPQVDAAALPVTPFVVARDQIPAIIDTATNLHARHFVAHEEIARAASTGAALAWIEAPAGGRVELRAHHAPTLLAILRGRATLVGTVATAGAGRAAPAMNAVTGAAGARQVEPGDVLTVPAEHSYGFAQIHADLHVLQVALQEQSGEAEAERELSLDSLLARNGVRAKQALESPFYVLLRDALLDTQDKRAAACEAIRVFSDAFQNFLFTRQAMCRDEAYFAAFHGHLLEELGHNDLLRVSGNPRISRDPILRATSVWFSHQMLKLDNAGKAVVNLVLETSGYYFHTLAKPVFADGHSATYFAAHAEADEEHMDLGVELLAGLHPDTYRRLLELLDESWDMLQTVTTRFAELVALEVEATSYAAAQ